MIVPAHRALRGLVCLALLMLSSGLLAQEANPSSEAHELPRSTGPIVVDGRVEEAAWDEALHLSLRFETRPGENIEAQVDTEVFLTYDDRSLYVAFKAYDPDPTQIRAHLTDRDTAWHDDFVGIVLDPFNDERRAFEIFVNPLGVQMDSFLDDLMGNEDASWDAIWKSAGRITEEGYEVEIAIPFHQLRFPRIDGVQTWGLDLLRFYPRNQRYRLALQPLSREIDCYLCQISKMEGLVGITPGRNLEIVPTLTSVRTDEHEELSDEPLPEGDLDTEAGLTVKWGFTPNMILNGTINPDFSQVEADVAQLDVNERFAIFFPERRPFFLEGADFFDTPFKAVFTRNVFDPEWGAKVTGKEGKNALGAFVARDEVTTLLFPGSQESDGEQFEFASVDAVARYRRDLPRNSSIGILGTSREGGDYFNHLAAVDGLVRFSDVDSVVVQYLYSQTEYPTEIAEEFDQPFGSFADDALGIAYEHDGRNWGWWASHHNIGTDFRADMGFVPKVDLVQGGGGTRYIWWGEDGDWWTRAEVGGRWNQEWDQSGQQLERLVDVWAEMGGPQQSWLWLNYNDKMEFFDGVEFPQKFAKTFFRIRPSGSLFFRLFARFGDGVDYANTQPGDLLVLEPAVQLNLGRRTKVDLSHDLQRFDRAEGRLFDAGLTRLRLVYQFNRRTFVRLVTQYFDIRRNLDLYLDEDEQARTRSLFNQVLFSYTVNPQTVVFVGYSDSREADDTFDLTATGRTLFVKLGYAWIP